MQLERILHSQGFGSRRQCQTLISQGEVQVAGVTCYDPAAEFSTDALCFSVAGTPWQFRDKVYLALYKPAGFECSRTPQHHSSVFELLPEPLRERGVQCVGRLDQDTTGLLLLSDDGAFIHAQSSPKRHVPKVYLATTHEPVTDQLVEQLLSGVQLHDEPAPLFALVCKKVADYQCEIVLEQGKYHQVKRMLAAAGNHCSALQRVAVGNLTLAELGLEEGEWCYLEDHHLTLLAADSK